MAIVSAMSFRARRTISANVLRREGEAPSWIEKEEKICLDQGGNVGTLKGSAPSPNHQSEGHVVLAWKPRQLIGQLSSAVDSL